MNVTILNTETKESVSAKIHDGNKFSLPSIQEGWRFNFQNLAKSKEAKTYVWVSEETPSTIEGCLIYKMRNKLEPYMAYIEIAPRNKGEKKKYDRVAGCLIAYACRLSFKLGKEDYKGWLAFDVLEADKKDEEKLVALYGREYKARNFRNNSHDYSAGRW